MQIKNVAVLVSGGGTNLQAILDAIDRGEIPARVSVVISDRAGAFALERAKKHGIPTVVVSKKMYPEKEAANAALLAALDAAKPDLIVLAGYIPILDAEIVRAYSNRIINIHPALIPSFCGKGYYGHRVHEAAIAYGVKVSGATVHFVDEGTDTGPIIFQECVNVEDDDDAETLAKRVLEVEHRLLPKAVKLFLEGRISVSGRRVTIR